jgi:hypothetical protein
MSQPKEEARPDVLGEPQRRFAFRWARLPAYNFPMKPFIERASLCVTVPCLVWLLLDCAFRIVIRIPFFPGSVGAFAILGFAALIVHLAVKDTPDKTGKP